MIRYNECDQRPQTARKQRIRDTHHDHTVIWIYVREC